MNYYPFHVGDYTSHTSHLEPMEDLAFRRMLDLYYLRELPLPAEVVEVARLIRLRQAINEVQAVLTEFFTLGEDGWRHTRCDEEVQKMQGKQTKARESAAASVSARKAKADIENQSNGRTANAKLPLNERSTDVELPTPTPTPQPSFHSGVENASPQSGSRLPADWQLPEAWAVWAKQTRPDLDPQETANRFADYWHSIPGAKGRKIDWQATWRNWVRQEKTPARQMAAMPQTKAARQATDKAWIEELMGRPPERLPGNIIDIFDAQVVGVSP